MSPQTLLTSIRDELAESSAAYWTDAELYRHMWHGEYILADKTNCTEATTAITTVTSQSDYTSPATTLHYLRVEYNNVKLKRISKQERDAIEFRSYGGSFTAGNPQFFMEFGNKLTLYPVPDNAKTVNIDHVKRPDEITTASTQFTIPEQFQFYIKDYVMSRALPKDEQQSLGRDYTQKWKEDLVTATQEWVDRNSTGRYSTVKSEDVFPTTEIGII